MNTRVLILKHVQNLRDWLMYAYFFVSDWIRITVQIGYEDVFLWKEEVSAVFALARQEEKDSFIFRILYGFLLQLYIQ